MHRDMVAVAPMSAKMFPEMIIITHSVHDIPDINTRVKTVEYMGITVNSDVLQRTHASRCSIPSYSSLKKGIEILRGK
jgi:hypothetical protein